MFVLGVCVKIEQEEFNNLLNEINDLTEYYTQITNSILESYTKDFDELMVDLKRDIIDNEPTDMLLEKYLLELDNILYFLGSKLESVGIKEDISNLLTKEVYNNSYLNNRVKDIEKRNKFTVAELTALAENDSTQQSVIRSIYSRVYKQIKLKIDAGYDTVNSLRKIITRRMQETNLSSFTPKSTYLTENTQGDY